MSLRKHLENLRDRAFVLTLVDTGLRISEACSLKYDNIEWKKQRGLLDKGDKREIIRFSNRALRALKEYLDARAYTGASSPLLLFSQPLFARHDIRASKKIRPITPGGMWKAIKNRISEAGVGRNTVRIQDFRTYFVARAYFATRDIKLSQELARHASISSTNRYVHLGSEADDAYNEIFNK
jgi:integrase